MRPSAARHCRVVMWVRNACSRHDRLEPDPKVELGCDAVGVVRHEPERYPLLSLLSPAATASLSISVVRASLPERFGKGPLSPRYRAGWLQICLVTAHGTLLERGDGGEGAPATLTVTF